MHPIDKLPAHTPGSTTLDRGADPGQVHMTRPITNDAIAPAASETMSPALTPQQVRVKTVIATIWPRVAVGGVEFNITLQRRFKAGAGWRHSSSFPAADLEVLLRLIQDTIAVVHELELESRIARGEMPAPARKPRSSIRSNVTAATARSKASPERISAASKAQLKPSARSR